MHTKQTHKKHYNITQKTKKINNTDPTKNKGERTQVKGKQFLILIRHRCVTHTVKSGKSSFDDRGKNLSEREKIHLSNEYFITVKQFVMRTVDFWRNFNA